MASFTSPPFDQYHQQQHHQNHQQRLQSLLDQRERINAELNELAILQSSVLPSSSTVPVHHGRPRQFSQHDDVPRTYGISGTPMSRHMSSNRSHRGPPDGSRSMSQRSGSAMARTASRPATSGPIPFSNTGRIPPALHPIDARPDAPLVDSWTTREDDPLNAYTLHHQPFPEVGEDPREFLSRPMAPVLSLSPTTTNLPLAPLQSPPRHRLSTSSRRSQTFGIQTPSTPSTLTTATTMASDMSRQSSFCPDALESFQMMNVNSNTSMFSDSALSDDMGYAGNIAFQEPMYPKKGFLGEEQGILLSGAGAVSYAQSDLSPQTAVPDSSLQLPLVAAEQEMKRSRSNESSSSTSSQSRAKLQLQKQNQLAARRLAPKAGSEDDTIVQKASISVIRIKSKDGADDRLVTAIPKAPYQRPKHDRVFCEHCTDYPDGFRGPHELGRHQDRTHKDLVKKWVCVEPVDGGINSQYRPVNPLSKCKACSTHKKKYGAYYNAAAHLRRAHFVPKPRGRSKSSKMDDKSEKRGGKGGGDWPPMTELKRWMKEVYEHAADNQPQLDEEEEDEDFVGSCEDDTSTLAATSIGMSMAAPHYDQQALPADISMIDAFAAAPSDFTAPDMQSMSNMSYDGLLAQGIDCSMLYDPTQTSFDSTSGLMNDNMAFINSNFAFEDQNSLGHDLVPSFSSYAM